MEKTIINIFDSPADEITLPGETLRINDVEISEEDIKKKLRLATELISDGVEKAISGDMVKSVLLPEDLDIMQPNYVIDLTHVGDIESIQAMALDAILDEDGDMAVYLYKTGSIQKVGVAHSWLLNRVIVSAMKNVFGDKCLIYRNYSPDKEVEIIDSKDLTHLRLSI